MIILGVDFGDARTGLASCDKCEMMAVGAGCVSGGFKKALEGACDAAKKLGAELIVVGNPINMNGSEGPRSAKCRDFAAELEASGTKGIMLAHLSRENNYPPLAERTVAAKLCGEARLTVAAPSEPVLLAEF